MVVILFRFSAGIVDNAITMIRWGIGGNASNSANLMLAEPPLMVKTLASGWFTDNSFRRCLKSDDQMSIILILYQTLPSRIQRLGSVELRRIGEMPWDPVNLVYPITKDRFSTVERQR